jgi:hypothetical protein
MRNEPNLEKQVSFGHRIRVFAFQAQTPAWGRVRHCHHAARGFRKSLTNP